MWFLSQCVSRMWAIQPRQLHSDHITDNRALHPHAIKLTSDALIDVSCLILSPACTHLNLVGQAPKCPGQSFGKKWRKLYILQALYCHLVWLPGLWLTSTPPHWGMWHFLAHLLRWNISFSFLYFSRSLFPLFSFLCFQPGLRCQILWWRWACSPLLISYPAFDVWQHFSLIPSLLLYNSVSLCSPQRLRPLEV